MKRWIIGLAVIGVITMTPLTQAEVITIDFEDTPVADVALPEDYAGLTWDSQWHSWTANSSYIPSSGTQVIYTHNYGGWIDFGQDVTFLGSWVSSYDAGQEMWWEGFNEGSKVYESVHLNGGAAAWINVSWSGVDKVGFVSTDYNSFIVDDVKYNNVIPEPSTFAALVGMGIVGLISIGWRRRRKAT